MHLSHACSWDPYLWRGQKRNQKQGKDPGSTRDILTVYYNGHKAAIPKVKGSRIGSPEGSPRQVGPLQIMVTLPEPEVLQSSAYKEEKTEKAKRKIPNGANG